MTQDKSEFRSCSKRTKNYH